MSLFDVAKKKIEKQIENRQELTKGTHSDQPIANMSRRAYWKGYVDAKKEDLAVLGDLHHAWYESQKTLKELFKKFPKPYEDGKGLKWFSWIEIMEWKEKAEKLLEEATK